MKSTKTKKILYLDTQILILYEENILRDNPVPTNHGD